MTNLIQYTCVGCFADTRSVFREPTICALRVAFWHRIRDVNFWFDLERVPLFSVVISFRLRFTFPHHPDPFNAYLLFPAAALLHRLLNNRSRKHVRICQQIRNRNQNLHFCRKENFLWLFPFDFRFLYCFDFDSFMALSSLFYIFRLSISNNLFNWHLNSLTAACWLLMLRISGIFYKNWIF